MVKTFSGSKVKLKGAESNTYRMARKFLDMNLYDIRTNSNTVTINGTTINLGKVGSIIKMFVAVINLGCNIAVAATGALTAFYSHLI
ncbi:hypothetical protein [Sharpea azabuensis]|uniref:hypothetical protein n=1 Tax=Sharpea azabuensis TaxID=322505 RepID=UPI00156A4987|nr:hypothetical protein [Sharpea azabuensis]